MVLGAAAALFRQAPRALGLGRPRKAELDFHANASAVTPPSSSQLERAPPVRRRCVSGKLVVPSKGRKSKSKRPPFQAATTRF